MRRPALGAFMTVQEVLALLTQEKSNAFKNNAPPPFIQGIEHAIAMIRIKIREEVQDERVN
jgi:hypothetical protein